MTDDWGWVHIHGTTVKFSARTYPTPEEARAGLEAHLDAQHSEAVHQLRDLPVYASYRSAAHLPGHTWRVQRSHSEVRLFIGDDLRTYRRPAPAPAPAPAKARRPSMVTDSQILRRLQVVGGIILVGGVGASFSGDFEGDRVSTLLLFPLGLALVCSPVLLDLLGLRRGKRQRE